MNGIESTHLLMIASLGLMGLVSGLHCVGMCGPIVTGLGAGFERVRLTIGGRVPTPGWRVRLPLVNDFLWYHAGRVWTYAMLGWIVGTLGHTVQQRAAVLGWQRPASLAVAVLVVATGVLLLGWVKLPKWESALSGCGGSGGRWPWLTALMQMRSRWAKLVLGMAMGLLPCGLVYAALAVAATLPRPWMAAAGMACFGAGTVPWLLGVTLAAGVVPGGARMWGSRLAGVLVIVSGLWMGARVVMSSPQAPCPMCEMAESGG